MRRRTGIFIAIGLLVIITIVAGFVIIKGSKSDSNVKMVSGEQQSQLWTCGMHPEVILNEPGN